MDRVDLDKLATIIESPAVTEARRRRFAELFAAPVEPVWRVSTEPRNDFVEFNGLAAANVTVGPWRKDRAEQAEG